MSRPVITDARDLSQRLGALKGSPGVTLTTGQVTAVDGSGNVTLNIAGAALTGLQLPGVPLAVNDNVLVLQQSGTYFIVALLAGAGRPISGAVASVPSSSSTIIVTTAVGSLEMGWSAAYSPTVGDAVWIAWLGSTPIVMGKQGKTGTPPAPTPPAPPPKPPPPPPPKITTGTSTFVASSSGTRRGSEWLSDGISNGNVMQGSYGSYGANYGAWFYSGRPHSTLAGATVTGARIYLARTNGGTYAAQTIHLSRVSNNTRPSGGLSFDSGHATNAISLAVGQKGWYTLPVSIAQALVTSGGSIGVTSSDPYVRLWGVKNSGSAGALRISWKRSS